jgi:signal peptidase I
MQSDSRTERPDPSPDELGRAGQEIKAEVIKFAKLLGLFLVVFLLLRGLIVEWVPVNGPSMLPNLQDGDRILVYKLPQTLRGLPFMGDFGKFEAGDVVVFDSPEDRRRYVKRVIASGPELPQPHVANAMATGNDGSETLVRFEEGAVYVNNRRLEEPWIADPERQAQGRDQVSLASGQYYVLGDNRPVSKDSRRIGPVEQEAIIGRAVLRFWPLSRFGSL